MIKNLKGNDNFCKDERGAALVTVLMITVLLGIACIALLSSVGANSRNSTDVLSETKAYYAAESGLQSTINILRNTSTKYSQASASPNDLSNVGLTYNCSGKVSVGGTDCTDAETFYSLYVTDPDRSGNSTTFSTSGNFTNSNVSTYPTSNGANRYVFTFTPPTPNNCTITFVPTYSTTCGTNPLLGNLNVEKVGNGGNFNETVKFSINYAITSPRPAMVTISGNITKANSDNYVKITFPTNQITNLGSTVTLCQNSSGACTATTNYLLTSPSTQANDTQISIPIYMNTTPVEPYRLKVLSTGFGPNKAKKQLEAVIQADLLNGEVSPSAFTLQGPVSSTSFRPGTSGAFQILGENGTISQPSIGVINQTSLNNVNGSISCQPQCIISPPPAIVSSIPSWLQTPSNLDVFIDSFRQAALTSNPRRYFTTSDQPTTYGDNATGTGLTFCDGNCTIGGNTSGGGTLIVTGTLITNGAFNFKGLILITGPGGWMRQGNGGGVIQGSVVIAPYDADSLAANVFSLPPTYNSNGSGNSTIDNDAVTVSQAFNGTNALTDLMIGIAEK